MKRFALRIRSRMMGGLTVPRQHDLRRAEAAGSWPQPSGARRRSGPSAATPCGRALILALLIGLPGPALAGKDDRLADPDSRSPAPCVAVDIGGQRAGHLDCAARRLEQAARDAQRKAGRPDGIQIPQAGSPDVRVGVSSLAGTRLRMGGNLGSSVLPARPPVTPVNPMGPRR